MMRIQVLKFGGTSVTTAESRARAASIVGQVMDRGVTPVVVVSAMGRQGDPYATDTLLKLVEADADVKPDTDRDVDLLLMCGEVISAVTFAHVLHAHGRRAQVFTGAQAGVITDGRHRDAKILRVEPKAVRDVLEQGLIPVVAGFQGATVDGEITTLGRGGSDTTAAALGAALQAEEVVIYTDVDGILTADPRIVAEARILERVDYDETFQLAHAGARVVHPRAVEIARQFNVPLRVKSTFSDHPGTLIAYRADTLDIWQSRQSDRVVTGVTHLMGLAQVQVEGPAASPPDFDHVLFRSLAERGISVDLINVFPDRKVFCVMGTDVAATRSALADMDVCASILERLAKVSIVGSAIHGLPGVMAHVTGALASIGARILATADSTLSISCLLAEDDMVAAVRALHSEFHLGETA